MTARVLASTVGMAWADVLKLRRLGGSDAPVIAGVSPWQGPVGLWMEKTGMTPGPDESEQMYWGTHLEEPIARRFAAQNGLKVTRRHALLMHAEHDFATCNLDRQVLVPGDGWIPLQIKTSGWGHDWTDDEAPVHVTVQVQHELAVTEAPYEFLAVLIGGNRYRDYVVPRDDDLIAELLTAEAEFWAHVEARTMPPWIDGKPATTDALGRLYARLEGDMVALPAEALKLRDQYLLAKAEAKVAEAVAAEAGNELRALLGAAGGEVGFVDGEKVVTWRRPVPKTPVFDAARHAAQVSDCHASFTALPDPESMARRLTVHKAPKGS